MPYSHTEKRCQAEAYANSDLASIEKWAWDNKMKFNDSNSKAIITRKRRLDKTNTFLKNRSLEQVDVMKYLEIHLDNILILQAY